MLTSPGSPRQQLRRNRILAGPVQGSHHDDSNHLHPRRRARRRTQPRSIGLSILARPRSFRGILGRGSQGKIPRLVGMHGASLLCVYSELLNCRLWRLVLSDGFF